MGGGGSRQCTPQRRRLFFERDKAGWNNVRISFESYCVAAALTGRQLILPPPSRISHLDALFHELQVYDALSLPPFASGDVAQEVLGVDSVTELLSRDALLPADIRLTEKSRLQHFECLPLTEAAARRAAEVVLSMCPASTYEDAMRGALERLNLRRFDSLHLRRGDFAQFHPSSQFAGSELVARVREALPGEAPLLVACVTDEKPDPVEELALHLSRRVVRTDDLYGAHDAPLHRIVVDQLALAEGDRFVGTAKSTFSTGVWHFRNRARAAARKLPEQPVALQSLNQPDDGMCWERITTFSNLR
jgi:hypothetical protein